MVEREIIGDIDENIFNKAIKTAEQLYGKPLHMRRIALMVHNRATQHLNTRVRVSVTKDHTLSEIMQKISIERRGGFRSKEEISVPLENKPEYVAKAYMTLLNMVKDTKDAELVLLAVQHNNFIWEIEKDGYRAELKLSHQFGKSDYYTFEIELFDNAPESIINSIQTELNLYETKEHDSKERRKLRTEGVDTEIAGFDEGQIVGLLKNYL